jgi:hypothetical protein
MLFYGCKKYRIRIYFGKTKMLAYHSEYASVLKGLGNEMGCIFVDMHG